MSEEVGRRDRRRETRLKVVGRAVFSTLNAFENYLESFKNSIPAGTDLVGVLIEVGPCNMVRSLDFLRKVTEAFYQFKVLKLLV